MDRAPTDFDIDLLGFLCGPPNFKQALNIYGYTKNKLPLIILQNTEKEHLVIYEGPKNDYLVQFHANNKYIRSQYYTKKYIKEAIIDTATLHAGFTFIKGNETMLK